VILEDLFLEDGLCSLFFPIHHPSVIGGLVDRHDFIQRLVQPSFGWVKHIVDG